MAVLSVVLFAGKAYAQQWIDITDSYIVNPRFDNNDRRTGWSGTEYNAANPKGNAEFWNYYYFDAYQSIGPLIPNAKYRLSLSAFYRYGTSSQDYDVYSKGEGDDVRYAKLYVEDEENTEEEPILLFSSGGVKTPLSNGYTTVGAGAKRLYVPNNMESADAWFKAGYYNNVLEFEAWSSNTINIGIRKYDYKPEDWVCLDDWKLEVWGTMVYVTKVTLSQTSATMMLGEELYLTATTAPTNATYRNVKWSSSNESIATIDATGKILAKGVGTCTITATSVDSHKASASCKVTVSKDDIEMGSIIINEVMAANVDVYRDPSTNFGSWVELYNPTDKNVPLGGLYVSDDPANLKKHQLILTYGVLPAKGFAVLNFDHYEVWTEKSLRQIDDKLDVDGGTIIVSDGERVFAKLDYPQAIGRVSYARTTDGGDTWGTTAYPTPGASNATSTFATEQLAAPVVDKMGQLFTGTLNVTVTKPLGTSLYYTTDGSTPTETNGTKSVASNTKLAIKETTTYRFRLFRKGYLPSPVVTCTYIYKDKDYILPIISVVSDEENFTSPEYGVRTQGNGNGRPGNGYSSPCNWNMDWDRPVNFEYITSDNECVVSQECDYATCGGWSRGSNNWTQMGGASFKLKAGKLYDLKSSFDYQFFDNKPYLKHKTLQIRQGGNDSYARFIDPALQEVIRRSGIYVETQSWQPVHHFINGEYKGVLNMREPNNKHYAYANYGIDTDEMDQFEICPDSGYVQMEGTEDKFLEWYELSKNASNAATYENIKNIVDIDEYINYMAVEMYLGGTDWPQNNVKGFRDVKDGKFRFVIFDLDFAFNTSTPLSTFFSKQNYTFDTLHGYNYATGESIEGQHLYKEIKFVTIFKNMLANAEFRKKFIDTFCIVGGSTFHPDYANAIINEKAAMMREAMSLEWGADPTGSANKILSNLQSRENSMIRHLASSSEMKLSGSSAIKTYIESNVEGANIQVNGIEVPYGRFDGHLFAPVVIKAVTPAGYRFAGWYGNTPNINNVSNTVFKRGDKWSYYDGGSLDGTAWMDASYTDKSWANGASPVGYDTNGYKTMGTVCDDMNKSLPTLYLRKEFNLTHTPNSSIAYQLNYTLDDGMIVYVNGQEVYRENLPSGNVSYNTNASTYAFDNPNTGSINIDASYFQKGKNVIAVEVHNFLNPGSSDIMWDAELSYVDANESEGEFISTNPEFRVASGASDINLTAVYEPLSEEEIIAEGIVPVRVNEVCAANTMYVNDYFKKNDWIELYNTTGEDIDLAGMYLSDNINKTQKYQILEDDEYLNTIIPANGYKVIWCDKLENISEAIHASFKLDADSGVVVLSNYDGEDLQWADTLAYAAHQGTESFGRYPDGGRETYLMTKPTIAAANILTTYAQLMYVAPPTPEKSDTIPDKVDMIVQTSASGLKIVYVDGVLNIKSTESPITLVRLMSASGATISATAVRASSNFCTYSLNDLPQGIYIACATDTDGNTVTLKFRIQ